MKKFKTMKNIFSFLLIITCAMLMTSCEDFLDQEPSFALPVEETIKTADDLQNAVNGAYARLNEFDYYSGNFFPLGDLRADDMTFNSLLNANQISPVATYQYNKNSSFAELFYRAPYVTTGRVNNILNAVDNITLEPGEEERYNDMIGQLYALRALCHFDLARMFAQLPTALHDDVTLETPGKGIPICDAVFPVDYKPTRNTIREVYDFILADFDRAIERLNPSPSRSTSYGYINIWAAKALKARVHLYMGNYTEALSLAEDVIDNAGGSGYRLAEQTEYSSMWASVAQPEFLFEVVTTLVYNAQRNSLGYYSNPEGYAEYAVTEDFARWLVSFTSDFRSLMLKYVSQGKGRGYYCTKYPGRQGSIYVNNPKVIRMAEVYLIAIEAAYHGKNETKALEYMNKLRKTRIYNYKDVTTITLDDILNERRKELFAEGHRSWDVWRNQLSLVNNNFSSSPIAYDNYRTLLAIPQRERDISPGLEQNPGWE
jgi:hypothetical protein